jgi:beta-1,4-mannosyl-glycoprotein beta-1,4-N-acetylglucosaminyltransferase
MPKKIFDCFCYFNEDYLLELRFETLWDYVDVFVICESTYTFSGSPKPLNFNIERFGKYKSKIRYIVFDEDPKSFSDAWHYERSQRDFLINGLSDATPLDMVVVSDVDEIPNPKAFSLYDSGKFKRAALQQYMYSYYLNNRWEKDGVPAIWIGPKITTVANLNRFFTGSMQELRNYRGTGIFRGIYKSYLNKFSTQYLPDGGWHFTWMAGVDQVIKKLESFSHQEFNKAEYKNPEQIKDIVAQGRDILFPERRYVIQDIDSQFPDYLINHKENYQSYLL